LYNQAEQPLKDKMTRKVVVVGNQRSVAYFSATTGKWRRRTQFLFHLAFTLRGARQTPGSREYGKSREATIKIGVASVANMVIFPD
jgi:hypothetical protein